MRLTALCILLASIAAAQDKKLNCEDTHSQDRPHFCKMAEETLAGLSRLQVDAGNNGGITVKGWEQAGILVRSRIESWAASDSEARLIGGQIRVETAGGQVRASGPENRDRAGWSVSFEIFVPRTIDLGLKAHNGGIKIADVRGRLEFSTVNGGANLRRVAGDVVGNTVNGGVNVELDGSRWDGGKLEVKTTNGGVNIRVPANFAAHIQTETRNGGVHSDFPLPQTTERRSRNLDFDIGGGGSLIHVTTVNGGVNLRKS